MEIIGAAMMFFGWAVAVIASIWFLVAAFRESVLWGLACLLLPFVSLIFLALHWSEAAKPFGLQLLGTILALAGMVLVPGAIESMGV